MIYLDYQATTPLAPEAREAMLPWLDRSGNPHSAHRIGREAKAAVEAAREQVMQTLLPPTGLHALKAEVSGLQRDAETVAGRLFFTSGATEAANWAIRGSWTRRERGRDRIVTIATEHACVLDTNDALRSDGAEIVVLPVSRTGLVDLDALEAAVDERTALVAAMLVNNEIGMEQNIVRIGELARRAGATMFCDAAQGYGRLNVPLSVCDLVALSAHKIHGPKGIGALWVRPGYEPTPLMHGGGQEGGVRSGTLSPMLCAGFGAAAKVAWSRMGADMAHVGGLSRKLRAQLGHSWSLNGSLKNRYWGNLNLRRDGLDAARLISEVREVAFSAGSACASGSGRPSHVLRAIGLSDAEARASIRLGFGRYTTEAEVEEAAVLINAAAERQLAWA